LRGTPNRILTGYSPCPLVTDTTQRRNAIRCERRQPERSVLYAVLHEHLESLRALARAGDEHGVGLPRFVVRELRGFLDCRILAKGFARFRCQGCCLTRLVAFTCKGGGFCPSCGGRRMTQLAVPFNRPRRQSCDRSSRCSAPALS
jgi:Transposase zinc-binding domain